MKKQKREINKKEDNVSLDAGSNHSEDNESLRIPIKCEIES